MLTQDFREFIQLLNENSVRYLVVGGYAVAIHGHPRYTKDIDIWIERSFENTTNIVQALIRFGFDSLGLTQQDFLETDTIIQLGFPPNRIDILTSLSGIDFKDCYPSRKKVSIEGVVVDFIDLENLIKNKIASGRNQDLADLDHLR